MQLTNHTLAVLWLGAGAAALWRLLPAVLNALGLTLRRGIIDDDAGALEPLGEDAEYDELFTQLRRLGFWPIGTRRTTCWFFLHHWYRSFQSRVFAARQRDCIALVYKLRAWDPWRLCFVTAFSDGAIVETANQMESFRIEEPDFLRWGLATPDRGLLLERHREVCRAFAAAGSRRVALLPAEEMDGLIRHHELRYHRRCHRWTGLIYPSCTLVLPGLAFLLVHAFTGTAPYLLPGSILVWGFVWPVIHAFLFRAAAASFRAEDTHRHRSQPACSRLDLIADSGP